MPEKLQEKGRRYRPDRQMLRRTLFLMAVCGIAAFLLLLARLYKLQIIDHEYYEQLAIRQQLREAPTSSARGVIYDTNMNALAVSASVDNVYLSPAEIEMYGEDKALIADGLSKILGLDRGDILKKAGQTGSWYVTVARKVESDKADAVRRFKSEYGLRGVRLETDTKRYYPNSSLACHLIGFVGTDNYGLEGIEAQYDSALAGTAGKTVRATNAYGTELLFSRFEEFTPGEDGYDVVTTVDSTIQYYIEKHLKQAVEDYDIQNGAGAIAMDVNTGAILAMASLDGYDLNNFLAVSDKAQLAIDGAASEEEAQALLAQAQARQWRNKALSDTYEPGSTFKIITLSMALEEGKVGLNDSFYCPGTVSVIGRTKPIRCWKYGGHGSQTLTQAAQHSCNVAFVNIGQRVGAETFYKYCEAFGFLELSADKDANLTATTGIDLAGESGSIWWSQNTFCSEKNLSQLAAASFGQTFTITPLQLITAVSACVNGGYLYTPHFAQQITDSDGNVIWQHDDTPVRQVISEETSATVRECLEYVVASGTGKNGQVAGYRIGGKTGTADKGQSGDVVVSFLCFAPADDPQIMMLITMDTPSRSTGTYVSGGNMVAPYSSAIMAEILPYLGIEPSYSAEELMGVDTTVPNVIGMSVEEAKDRLKERGFACKVEGDGETITDQTPVGGAIIPGKSTVVLYAGAEKPDKMCTVPSLVGRTAAEANTAATNAGLLIRFTGTTSSESNTVLVFSQELEAGTEVPAGTVITVRLGDTTVRD